VVSPHGSAAVSPKSKYPICVAWDVNFWMKMKVGNVAIPTNLGNPVESIIHNILAKSAVQAMLEEREDSMSSFS